MLVRAKNDMGAFNGWSTCNIEVANLTVSIDFTERTRFKGSTRLTYDY